MNILFTKLSSGSSQLHSAAFYFILLWNFARGSFTSCLQLKNLYLSNVSILTSLYVSLSCSMNASVVHFDISECGFLWRKMLVASCLSDRCMRLLIFVSASYHGMLST